MMRVCFDSRPAADRRGIGRYARCLLDGLRHEAGRRGGEVVEGHPPRSLGDLFHSPWMAGALLRPRVPTVPFRRRSRRSSAAYASSRKPMAC